MSLNANLHSAKRQKNDEFYTQLSDIENELRHYRAHFAGKTVYCNCDDFFRFFLSKWHQTKNKCTNNYAIAQPRNCPR